MIMAEKATLYLENNKGMILEFTRSPQACDVYDFEGNQISGAAENPINLVTSFEVEVSTTSTTETLVITTEALPALLDNKIIYVVVQDKAGKREGYFYRTDAFIEVKNQTSVPCTTYRFLSGIVNNYIGYYGVYGRTVSNTGTLSIYSRYNSNYSKTIDGTYIVKVYTIEYPTSAPNA